MKDPIEYLRILLTNRCNLDCFYCHNEGRDSKKNNFLSIEQIINFSKMAYELGVKKFKLMGGEPTIYRGSDRVIAGIRSNSKDIDISMITNGILLKDYADNYLDAGIDRFNVSIHGWNFSRFKEITGGSKKSLFKIKESIDYLCQKGVISKINYLILKGKNETEILELIPWIGKRDLKIDLLNILYDSDSKAKLKKLHYSFTEIEEIIRSNFEVSSFSIEENKYSLPSKRLYLKNGATINLKVAQLNSKPPFYSCKSCPKLDYCVEGIRAIRLTEKGKIKPCLLRDDNQFSLKKEYLANGYRVALQKLSDYLNEL